MIHHLLPNMIISFFDNRRFTWYSKNQRCLSRNGKLTAEGKIAENYYTLEAFIKKKSGENFLLPWTS